MESLGQEFKPSENFCTAAAASDILDKVDGWICDSRHPSGATIETICFKIFVMQALPEARGGAHRTPRWRVFTGRHLHCAVRGMVQTLGFMCRGLLGLLWCTIPDIRWQVFEPQKSSQKATSGARDVISVGFDVAPNRLCDGLVLIGKKSPGRKLESVHTARIPWYLQHRGEVLIVRSGRGLLSCHGGGVSKAYRTLYGHGHV
ncbi:hypothetical protein BZA77DRAFT_139473 [Pyronema omphalodes]|nr:hypothetical protein BZA77DRAFT_139473 [Pyronema omphalodes]